MTHQRVCVWGRLAAVVLCLSVPASAQLVVGQYEDEAPFRTWNTFVFGSASALGRGETAFTLASDPGASLSNPALLSGLPKFALAVGGSFQNVSFNKYGMVNTGVFTTDGNMSLGLYDLDFAGVSVRVQGWTLALAVARTELYDRPKAAYQSTYRGTPYYLIQAGQTGDLNTFHLGLSWKISPRFSAGIGLNYMFGTLNRDFLEQIYGVGGYTITDHKSQDFRGFAVNGGLLFEFSSRFRTAAVFRTPTAKKAKSHSVLGYAAPDGATNISLVADSEDSARLPLVLGLGAAWDLLPDLTLAADASFWNWSKYTLDYFGEAQDRNFRDVVKINLGLEYRWTVRFLGHDVVSPFRIGASYDPQPMDDPRSSYYYLTIGAGLDGKVIRLDLGAAFGREWGSGNNLTARRVALSLGFGL